MSNRQSNEGVRGANIGDQSRACETRPCLFLQICIGVNSCTDIHTAYSTHCVVFVSHSKISELYSISKSHGRAALKADYHCSCTTVQHTIYYYCCINTPTICDENYGRLKYGLYNSASEDVTLEVPSIAFCYGCQNKIPDFCMHYLI